MATESHEGVYSCINAADLLIDDVAQIITYVCSRRRFIGYIGCEWFYCYHYPTKHVRQIILTSLEVEIEHNILKTLHVFNFVIENIKLKKQL